MPVSEVQVDTQFSCVFNVFNSGNEDSSSKSILFLLMTLTVSNLASLIFFSPSLPKQLQCLLP